MKAVAVVLTGAVLITACAPFETQRPVWPYPERPVATAPGTSQPAPDERAIDDYRRPEPESEEEFRPAPTTSSNSAVASLVGQAREESARGDLDRAAATLERALGIAPQDPLPWVELALVRFEQGNLVQAENLARRSLSFAGGRRDIGRAAWLLIADIKALQGDPAAERDARDRARTI